MDIHSHELTSIAYVASCGNYIILHYYDGRPKRMIRSTIKDFEKKFCILSLVRIHKRYIINLNHIQSCVKKNSSYVVSVSSAQGEITISRTYETSFLERYAFANAPVTFVKNDPGYLFL